MTIEHIVIIVKENHTVDNYYWTFPGAEGVALGAAENPPPSDLDHKHETWIKRANEARFMAAMTFRVISDWPSSSHSATTISPKPPAPLRPIIFGCKMS